MTGDHLLIFNLATDADDPILGFTTAWINRLAAHYARVDVITMRAGRLAVAGNVRVYSVGKERGYGEARRAFVFYRTLAGLLWRTRYTACFAHMMPLFAVMGWPLLILRGVPVTLWYVHRQAGRMVRLAARLVTHIVTATDDSFPVRNRKTRTIGHAVDTDFFCPAPAAASPSPIDEIVCIARIMPIKRQDALIRAAHALPIVRVVLVGDTPADVPAALAYRVNLDRLIVDLGMTDRVIFTGALTADGVRERARRATVCVNLSPPGLFDKAALESMACGTITLVTAPAFDPLLSEQADLLRLPLGWTADDLAARLRDLLALPTSDRAASGQHLREAVIAQHSFESLLPRLLAVLRGQPTAVSTEKDGI